MSLIRMNFNYYKTCKVPQCRNTSIKTPEKLFIHVPHNPVIRRKWLKLARRADAHTLSLKTRMHFCEDHFDLPNDMLNYIELTTMGRVSQVRMKEGCTPTKFHCQEDRRTRMSTNTDRPYMLKKQRMMIIAECLKQNEHKQSSTKYTTQSTKGPVTEPEHVLSRMEGSSYGSQAVRVKEEPDLPFLSHDRSFQISVYIKQEPDEIPDVKREAECGDEAVSVKTEPSSDSEDSHGISEAAVLAGLYTDHAVKDELVLGPEMPLRPPIASFHDGVRDASVTTREEPATRSQPAEDTVPPQITDNFQYVTTTYMCDICSKIFKRKNHLMRHIILHSRGHKKFEKP